MSTPLKVAVVGIGHLGKVHTRIYSELADAELVGICDSNSSTQEKAEELGIPFYSDHKELIGKIDAVSIATPTATHYAVAKDFLNAGIHTLIEKPITLKLEEADDLIRLAKEKKCSLQVGHLERHNPGLRRIGEIANNIRFFEIHRLGPFTGRINDCGVVLDLMIHDLDIVMQLVNAKIESLDAVGINVLTPFEDIANVRIKFTNGSVCDMTASRLTPEKQRKIRIFQEDAYISLDYGEQSAKIFKKEGFNISHEQVDITKAEPLKEELKFFIEGIRTGQNIGKPDQAARDALELALRIIDSIKANEEKNKAHLNK